MNVKGARVDADPAKPGSDTHGTDTASETLASWLLDGGVQLEVAPHSGGVIGSIDAAGQAEYVYPEITGYYMQWLAWRAACDGIATTLAHRAANAQRWLAAWIQRTDPPLTRVYLRPGSHDWRNDALFFFDLAMVLRGIASATRAGLIEPDQSLVRNVVAKLSRLIADDGLFNPWHSPATLVNIPDRWATRRGGFLAKAAAGVLSAAKILPLVDVRLQQAATATMLASLDAAIGQPHDDTHPALYAIEGALGCLDRRTIIRLLPALTNQIDMLLMYAAAHDGWLPEAGDAEGVERLDIVAQALRAAVLLRARCVNWSPDPQALEKMRHLLVRNIAPTGSLPFAPRATPLQQNVWCAMFAEQALQISKPAVSPARLFDLEMYLV